MAIVPDTDETFVIEARSFKAIAEGRRGILSARYAIPLDGEFHQDEFLLNSSTSKTLTSSLSLFLIIRSVASGLSVTFTKGVGTVTLPVNKLLIITSSLTNVSVSNVNTTGPAIKALVTWA